MSLIGWLVSECKTKVRTMICHLEALPGENINCSKVFLRMLLWSYIFVYGLGKVKQGKRGKKLSLLLF